MKTNLLKAIAFAMVMTPLYNCSVGPVEQELQLAEIANEQTLDDTPCSGEDPKSRVTNDSDNVVNFEIFDSNGALVNYVYGLNPGETSDWRTFTVGVTTFSISTSNSSKPVRIDMGICMAYDVTIDENNQLDTDLPVQL